MFASLFCCAARTGKIFHVCVPFLLCCTDRKISLPEHSETESQFRDGQQQITWPVPKTRGRNLENPKCMRRTQNIDAGYMQAVDGVGIALRLQTIEEFKIQKTQVHT